MDCNTARMLAEFRGNRETELPDEDNASLDDHIRSCPECHSRLQVERQLDAHIGRSMQAVAIPPGLKLRIRDRLATERGTYYRRRIFAVAAAAAVFFAVGLFIWGSSPKSRIDIQEVAQNADQFRDNPKTAVDLWLASQGIQFDLPEPFDPHLIVAYGISPMPGEQAPVAPMVLYHNIERNLFARVFILRDNDFVLANFQEMSKQVKVLRGAKVAYVILYDGDSLEPFRIRVGSA